MRSITLFLRLEMNQAIFRSVSLKSPPPRRLETCDGMASLPIGMARQAQARIALPEIASIRPSVSFDPGLA